MDREYHLNKDIVEAYLIFSSKNLNFGISCRNIVNKGNH
jgi:hypothetical protein